MTLFDQAKALGRQGRPAEAVALIEDAAARGDGEGNLILAHWLLYGTDRPRDARAAHRHLELAARQGSTLAVRMRANLTASGTGCEPDRDKAIEMLEQIAGEDPAAAAQLAMLPRMMPIAEAEKADREILSADPRVEIVRQLLLPEECDYVTGLAEPKLKPSLVWDAVTGRGKPDPIRTSHGAHFVPHDEDLVLQAINARLALASGTGVNQGEALTVMRYTPGQEYKPHLDALPGLRQQRACTAIAYLNGDYEGGATVFPELSISIRAGIGDVLIFTNIDANGRPDPGMRHGGEPVTRGEKWIATRWIREGPHDPYDRG
jgi:prolyl 4-hydroxylase